MSQSVYSFKLDLSMQLMSNLSKVDRFDSSWASVERREGATLKQLKSIATVRSVGASTRIEGSKMSDAEVEVLINRIKIGKLEERDEQEVAGYFAALDTIAEHFQDIQIAETHIKNIHKILMQFSEKDEWHRGDYKQLPNSVDEINHDGTKHTIFLTSEPGFPTQDAMRQLVEWYHADKETIPIVKIALFVYDFLSIHPFQDGNGRLSRLLGTLLLLKNGYSWIQYVSFEHEIENRKKEYYTVLMQTQRQRPGENVSNWLNFFTDCLLNIQNQLEEKLRTQKIQTILSGKEQNILNYIENHPDSKSSEIASKLDIPLPTVKKILAGLMQKKIISKMGVGKATTYLNESSKQIKKNAQFMLNATSKFQEFQFNNPVQHTSVTRIVLQPKFEWTTPDEWAQRLMKELLGFTISGINNKGETFSYPFSLFAMISPQHFQPVFIQDPPIQIPLGFFGKIPFQSDYPIHIKIQLTALRQVSDFDVFFIYDAII